ncbi:MAG: hypothetical protein CVU89_02235 [Firmicutes bacterium HGW-Firmicutes-14]|nr:MAG: hypothetical protein CVU89_02235 [Firmicutes bacterium HGW-Firmicutes-14]
MDRFSALKKVENLILTCGYDQNAIRRDYRFIDDKKVICSADMVVFSENKHLDVSTSCIAVVWTENGGDADNLIQRYRFLAAPFIIILNPLEVNIYDLRKQERYKSIVSYKLLEKYFSVNRLNYDKQNLLTAKNTDYFYQITLFAVNATKYKLVELFESAIRSEKNRLGEKYNDDITHVAIHVLAACIIEDKLWGYDTRVGNAVELIEKCLRYFHNYFKGIIGEPVKEQIAQNIFEDIRNQLTFQALTNDILGHLYEFAILDNDIRKMFGIHWTEENLAQQICKCMPFELIPEDKRYVLDGTCGSGSFLIAACNRLNKLLPMKMDRQYKHDLLTERITGVELDKFASEVAKLSLLVYSIPYGNRWNIINSDFFQVPLNRKPSIIMTNPPFDYDKNKEIAAKFMDKYLDALEPGGIMAIILPATYLEGSKCVKSRNKLLNSARIYEIWYLPENSFETSDVPVVVIILRKSEVGQRFSKYPVKSLFVSNNDYKLFKKSGRATKVIFNNAEEWINSPQKIISNSILDSCLKRIKVETSIGKLVSIDRGIEPKIKSNEDFCNEIAYDSAANWEKWLQSPGENILEPYKITWKNYRGHNRLYVRYPGKHHRGKEKVPFKSEKILLNVTRNSLSKWRIYGAIDRDGYYVSHGFYIMYDRTSSISYEELIAVINHPLTSLYIDKYNKKKYLNKDTVKNIPFPKFTETQKRIIINSVNRISELKNKKGPNWQHEVCGLIIDVDNIVYDAFQVPEFEREKIAEYFSDVCRPGEEWKDFISKKANSMQSDFPNAERTWKVFGTIKSIDIDKQTVTLSIDEYDGEQTIPIPPAMPGWALEQGTVFEAVIPFAQRNEVSLSRVNFLSFRMIDYGYLSDDEFYFMEQTSNNPPVISGGE